MSRKSRIFLGFATAALITSLTCRLFLPTPQPEIGDFASGLAVALLLGVVLTWKRPRSPRV